MAALLTFPMPYTNGPLHLGHAFSMLKVDYHARWLKMQGRTVLFPFAFHCTGIPIWAAAMKLKEGDITVKTMLLESGILETDIEKFCDPVQWITYFPDLALKTLKNLNMSCDYARSFITTSHNPYFDQFTKWFFSILQKKGYLIKGMRACIWSLKMNQPCAAHDRASGENAEPVLIMQRPDDDLAPTEQSPANEKMGFVKVVVIATGQILTVAKDIFIKCQEAQGHAEQFYVPNEKVRSRMGDECICKVTEQWYINYSDKSWKERTLQKARDMTIQNPIVRDQILTAVSQLHEWCCSREIGLGTKLPTDEKFVIDSLSDSTLYPLYYLLKPYFHSDIYGHMGIMPLGDVIPFLNYMYDFFNHTDAISNPVVSEPPRSWRDALCNVIFYYPMTLRISGKDLINNHLAMSLYAHQAIFDEVPKEYVCCGYLNLNKQKMSKSTGNYITIDDGIKKWGLDNLRFALANCGDLLEDGNLQTSDIITLKPLRSTAPITNAQSTHNEYSLYCFQQAFLAYKCHRYRDVCKWGYHMIKDPVLQQIIMHPIAPGTFPLPENYRDIISDAMSVIIPYETYVMHETAKELLQTLRAKGEKACKRKQLIDSFIIECSDKIWDILLESEALTQKMVIGHNNGKVISVVPTIIRQPQSDSSDSFKITAINK